MGNIRLGPIEILGILIIVVLLFGPGRISKVAGEIGRSIRDFRDGLKGEPDKGDDAATEVAKDAEKKS
jgi:sec-independent protein translocase protein TatA